MITLRYRIKQGIYKGYIFEGEEGSKNILTGWVISPTGYKYGPLSYTRDELEEADGTN